MKVCFAVQKDDGLESAVYGHFGSAPAFIVVDTETDQVQTIANGDLDHVHGACHPLRALGGLRLDAVVVGGIGAGAISGLQASGIRVYRSGAETVRENLEQIKKNALPELSVRNACGGHGHGPGGCSH